ncbi:protein kinase, variant 2 [Basidiobolus ranarum]|uniref:Protein kinase, variant 2 n=1 Tax=Basidiobolus ranarum TaxID=34480 RepID=A0ABR2W576_9FUNG
MENASNLQDYHEVFQKELIEIEELDDPIEVYLRYIGWLFDTYEMQQLRKLLLPLLEQATNHFKEDLRYSNDPRYFKLWTLYSKHTADPEAVFKHLQQIQIGSNLAAFYEEYANLLMKTERIEEAGKIFEKGIQSKAMPLVRLERRFKEFQKTTGYRARSKIQSDGDARPTRAEKLTVNLDLFYAQNEEFCFEEMRAKLAKYKAPGSKVKVLKDTELFSTSVSTENRNPSMKSAEPFTESNFKKKSLPSPTINTKAALADILEIFNQPLKCEQYDSDEEYLLMDKGVDKRSESLNSSQTRGSYDENQNPSYQDENSKKTNMASRMPFALKSHTDEKATAQPMKPKSFAVFQDSSQVTQDDLAFQQSHQNLNHSYSEQTVSSKQSDSLRSRKSLPNLHGRHSPLEDDDGPMSVYQDSLSESAKPFSRPEQENENFSKLPEKAFMVYQDANPVPSSRKNGRAFDVFCDENYSEPRSTQNAPPNLASNSSHRNPSQALFSVHKSSIFDQQETPQHSGRGSRGDYDNLSRSNQFRLSNANNPPNSSLLNRFTQKLHFSSDESDGENDEFRGMGSHY